MLNAGTEGHDRGIVGFCVKRVDKTEGSNAMFFCLHPTQRTRVCTHVSILHVRKNTLGVGKKSRL